MRRHSFECSSLVLLLALAAVVFCAPVEAAGATISGTVYQSDGTTPLTGKEVWISVNTGSPCDSPSGVGSTNVDSATGTYTITGLSAGTYYLRTSSSDNYVSEWWASPQSVWDCAGAQPVAVTEDKQEITGKDFQLDPGATISGTVYQSNGTTPLTGKFILVDALIGSPCGSNTLIGMTMVDSATGTYTITGLPAGTYYSHSTSLGDYTSEWWASPQSLWDCAGAQPVVVTEGEAVTGKDFQLELGATISGTVYQSDGKTALTDKEVWIDAYTGSPCGSLTGVGSMSVDSTTGNYTICCLPAGTYYLQTRSFDNYINEWWASPQSVRDCADVQPVVVTTEGQPVTGKDFQLEPGATISGTVYQSDGTTPLTGKEVWISVNTGSPCDSPSGVGSTNVDSATGTYTITGLPAGTYYLWTSSSDNYVSEWWASPLSVWDCAGAQPVVVAEGEAVTGKDFQLDPGATISGTVYQSDGTTPLTGKEVWINVYTGTTCGSLTHVGSSVGVDSATGNYTIPGLPAGTYYLQIYPSDNYISEWWAAPESVRDCAGAQPVEVTEQQAVTGKDFQLDPVVLGATVVVNPDPDSINAPWILTGPDGYYLSGQGDLTIANRIVGDYTITWGDVTNWVKPSPSSETKTVEDGSTTNFLGNYQIPVSEVLSSLDYLKWDQGYGVKYRVTDTYDDLDVPVWAVVQYRSDSEVLVTLVREGGSFYSWAMVGNVSEPWLTPAQSRFYGGCPVGNQANYYMMVDLPRNFQIGQSWSIAEWSYSVEYLGTVSVNGTDFQNCIKVSIDTTAMTGMMDYIKGTGHFILAKDVGIVRIVFKRTAGEYAGTVVQYEHDNHQTFVPHTISGKIYKGDGSPAAGMKVKIDGCSTFNQSVIGADGSFSIQAYGPDITLYVGYDYDNNGTFDSFDFQYYQEYTVNGITMNVSLGDMTLPFQDLPVGTIQVNPDPDSINARWTLAGPNGYYLSGQGDLTIANRIVGDYTITWGDVAGWTKPAGETKTVTDGGTTTFAGTYTRQVGTVVVNPDPDSINAPWTLTGPGSYSETGTGDQTLNNLPVGDYTIAWGDVAGWTTPSPASETKAVTSGETTIFTGAYSPPGGGFFVIPNKKGKAAIIYLE